MKKIIGVAGFIGIVIIIISVLYAFLHRGLKASHAIRLDPEKKLTAENTKKTGKLADSEYRPIAYEIAPVGSTNNEAKIAMFGFDMKKQQLSDGSLEVDLRPSDPRYQWKKFVLKPGYKLYFVDKTDDDEENGMTDTDAGSNGDDFPILVDPQGNIAPGQNLP